MISFFRSACWASLVSGEFTQVIAYLQQLFFKQYANGCGTKFFQANDLLRIWESLYLVPYISCPGEIHRVAMT
jgi:hypothetical protein